MVVCVTRNDEEDGFDSPCWLMDSNTHMWLVAETDYDVFEPKGVFTSESAAQEFMDKYKSAPKRRVLSYDIFRIPVNPQTYEDAFVD